MPPRGIQVIKDVGHASASMVECVMQCIDIYTWGLQHFHFHRLHVYTMPSRGCLHR